MVRRGRIGPAKLSGSTVYEEAKEWVGKWASKLARKFGFGEAARADESVGQLFEEMTP